MSSSRGAVTPVRIEPNPPSLFLAHLLPASSLAPKPRRSTWSRSSSPAPPPRPGRRSSRRHPRSPAACAAVPVSSRAAAAAVSAQRLCSISLSQCSDGIRERGEGLRPYPGGTSLGIMEAVHAVLVALARGTEIWGSIWALGTQTGIQLTLGP